MKDSEKADALKLAKLMRYARKQLGLTQVHVANHLNIAQGTYSKIEKAKFVLSAPEWFLFCKLTNIDVNSFVTGYIDRGEDVQVTDIYQLGSFKVPGKYGKSAGTSVRELQPYFQLYRKQFGEDHLDATLRDTFKIDPDYFIDLGHRVNYLFLVDLINFIAQKCGLSAETVKSIASYGALPESHGCLFNQYKNDTDLNVVEKLIANTSKYQVNTFYKIENKTTDSILISATTNNQVVDEKHLKNAQVNDFLVAYRASYLENFVRAHTGKNNIEVKVVKEDDKHSFKIQSLS